MRKRAQVVLYVFAFVLGLFTLFPGISLAAPATPTGLNGACTTNACTLTWSAVSGATEYNVYSSTTSGGVYTKINTSVITSTSYTNIGLTASTTLYYKVASVNASGTSALSAAVSKSTTLNFGPNVHIYDAAMTAAAIQGDADAVFAAQETAEFGNGRYALLFKPGTYTGLNVKVGFYTQVSGLGQDPSVVSITGGVNANADWSNGNALVNFWRSLENLTVTPTTGTNAQWAVSQASPVRRVHVIGALDLYDFDTSWNAGTASGGFLADSKIDNGITSASQQQWFSRNNQYGSWSNGVWNQVFVGDMTPPVTTDVFPTQPYTVVTKTPVMREKPYLYVNSSGQYQVFVPSLQSNTQGVTWASSSTPGQSIAINQFYIVDATSNAASINAALAQGKNLIFTPGIYHLTDTLRVTNANTVVLGLGYATLIPDTGLPAMTVADVDGVKIAGLLIEAGLTNSPVLMEVGPVSSSLNHASNPTSLHDVFFAIGGAIAGKADVGLKINSNNVIGDHFWIWRADHGAGATWTGNPSSNGLIVNGANVTIYGLFNEHFEKYQTLWNGNGGRLYFYQSEIPYDVPNQAAWMSGTINGYASYKVADTVTSHEAWGVGVYSYFRDAIVSLNSGIEVPSAAGVKIHHATSIFLAGNGGITHVINNSGSTANSSGIRQTIREFAGGVADDSQAPTIPTNLTATAVSGSQINLNWTASTDNVGVTSYEIYRYGTLIGTSTTTSYNDTALTAATSYSYAVKAKDASGNMSLPSITASAITTPVPISSVGKKGLGSSKYVVNNGSQANFSKIQNVGAGWTYNWSINYTGTNPTNIEYVPQIWGPGAVTPATFTTIAQGKTAGTYKYLLTFNEPELYEQSNMSVESAIALWPSLMNTGLRLSSPAVALSAETYAYGQTWLENFMNAAGANGYHVDFIAVHYYPDFMNPNAVNNLKTSLTDLYNKYHKPIWITELGAINAGQLSAAPTVAGAQQFMTSVVPMLESLSFVERYAWFDDNCSNDAGCAYTTLYDSSDNLTALGTTYTNVITKAPLFRFGWTVTANPTSSEPASNMLDNNLSTRWSTAAAQIPGQYFIVDMVSAKTFSQIMMDAGGTSDYARGYDIYVSNDGTNWGSAVASGVGSTSTITVNMAAQNARYIKVVQTGSAPANYWSIYELNVCY